MKLEEATLNVWGGGGGGGGGGRALTELELAAEAAGMTQEELELAELERAMAAGN